MYFFRHWWFRLRYRALYRQASAITIGLSVRYETAKHPSRASAFLVAPGLLCTARHVVEKTQWLWAHSKENMISVKRENIHIVPTADIAFIVVPELADVPLAPHVAPKTDTLPLTVMLRTPFGLTTILRAEEPVWGETCHHGMHVEDFRYQHSWLFTQHDNLTVSTHKAMAGDSGSALFTIDGAITGMVIQRVYDVCLKTAPKHEWPILTFSIPITDIVAEARKLGLMA